MDLVANIIAGLLAASIPLLLAALGELVVEKSGVLNLGVEGMMAIGAVAGFSAAFLSGSFVVGLFAAVLAGMMLAALFGALVLGLRANQVAAGLALTLFGLGLAALIGSGMSGRSLAPAARLNIPGLSDLPLVGKALFSHDLLTYLALALVVVVWWFLTRSRAGLVLRAIGENHDAAHAVGFSVLHYRAAAILFGGALAGLGGAYLALVQNPFWAERMTNGRGWIALALVVFAAWRPLRLLAGALFFGGISILQLHSQAFGVTIDPQILAMLPYLATIAALVLLARRTGRGAGAAPAMLGKAFSPPS